MPIGKTTGAETRSLFAMALARLLDDTSYFTRAEWARFLGVSESALSQWVNDKTVPRADLLRTVLDILQRTANIPPEPLVEFEKLSRQPATQISPLGVRMVPTVADYLRGATLGDLGRGLRDLSPSQQIGVLRDGGWRVDASAALLPPSEANLAGSESTFWVLSDFAEKHRKIESNLLPQLQIGAQSRNHSGQVEWDALLSRQRVLIIGTAGSGKSHVLSALVSAARLERALPICVQARGSEVPLSGATLLELCTRATQGAEVPIFIDGLDEVPAENRRKAANEVIEVAHRLKTTRLFVASRPVPELSLLNSFEKFSVSPLTSVQMLLSLQRSIQSGVFQRKTGSNELRRFICHMTERKELFSDFRSPLFLDTAWSLFMRNAVTPFSEAEVVGEFVRGILDVRDREKNLVRAREPWASAWSLSAILSELCFRLVHSKKAEFETHEAESWIATRFHDVPSERLLPLLSVQNWIVSDGGRHRVTHEYFRRYFAALRVVESAGDASRHLRGWPHHADLREVLRLACGIATDATSLLKGVLDARDASDPDRCQLLAEILAQPVTADRDVIAASCDTLVAWLDTTLKDWRLEASSDDGLEDAETFWQLRAAGTADDRYDRRVSRTLLAIHQARSGPACERLTEQMGNASSPVLPAFADAMEIEGHLHVRLVPYAKERMLCAAVVAPRLM